MGAKDVIFVASGYLFKRFVLGWYGVEQRLNSIDEKIGRISTELDGLKHETDEVLNRVCDTCPVKR